MRFGVPLTLGLLAAGSIACHLVTGYGPAIDADASAVGDGRPAGDAAGDTASIADTAVLLPPCSGRAGEVVTLAGDGSEGSRDGPIAQATFGAPNAIAFAPGGALFVVERRNNAVRRVTLVVEILAGGTRGYADGVGTKAQFNKPQGLTVDATGQILVADTENHLIRRVTPLGVVSTLAGTPGVKGYRDGAANQALFASPRGLAADASGALFVADLDNDRIRRIDPAGTVASFAGSENGYLDGSVATARFNSPYGLALGPGGALYVAERGNDRIRVIENGQVKTVAGTGNPGFLDGPAANAMFDGPHGIAVHPSGAIIVADTQNHRIRQISGTEVTTLAGDGAQGSRDGPAATAQFNLPYDVAVSAGGIVIVAEDQHRLRAICP